MKGWDWKPSQGLKVDYVYVAAKLRGIPVKGVGITVADQHGSQHLEGTKS